MEKFIAEQNPDKNLKKDKAVSNVNIFAIEKELENMPVPELREIGMTYGDLRKQYIEEGVIGDMGIIEFKKWYDKNQRNGKNPKKPLRRAA